ncbi:hypothetical protein C8R44DRAFT_252079 [Mycena epipterygia]|nr:hypothetical protein C8R44DRAFT_252079 [Mycena epipterygia]
MVCLLWSASAAGPCCSTFSGDTSSRRSSTSRGHRHEHRCFHLHPHARVTSPPGHHKLGASLPSTHRNHAITQSEFVSRPLWQASPRRESCVSPLNAHLHATPHQITTYRVTGTHDARRRAGSSAEERNKLWFYTGGRAGGRARVSEWRVAMHRQSRYIALPPIYHQSAARVSAPAFRVGSRVATLSRAVCISTLRSLRQEACSGSSRVSSLRPWLAVGPSYLVSGLRACSAVTSSSSSLDARYAVTAHGGRVRLSECAVGDLFSTFQLGFSQPYSIACRSRRVQAALVFGAPCHDCTNDPAATLPFPSHRMDREAPCMGLQCRRIHTREGG